MHNYVDVRTDARTGYVYQRIAIDLCGLPKITDFCCNYFEVLHLYKLPASAYFIGASLNCLP